jgi:hypothetical protein
MISPEEGVLYILNRVYVNEKCPVRRMTVLMFLTALRHFDNITILIMRKHLPLNIISRLILLVLLTAIINGVCGNTHAMDSHASGPCSPTNYSDVTSPHECPCSPDGQHSDDDGCSRCVNCACHAPLIMNRFQLVYTPVIADLQIITPLTVLPEVFLSLFVPPDSADV